MQDLWRLLSCGDVTTDASDALVVVHGGTFYNTGNRKRLHHVTLCMAAYFTKTHTFSAEAARAMYLAAFFTKMYRPLVAPEATNNIWAGMFFDTSVASQFAEGTVSMNVIFSRKRRHF